MSHDPRLLEAMMGLQPLASLPAERLRQLAPHAQRRVLALGSELTAVQDLSAESVYLLRGELRLIYVDGSFEVVVGGSDQTRRPLGRQLRVRAARAVTEIEVLAFDEEALDALLTWDQLSGGPEDEPAVDEPEKTGWYTASTLIRVQTLARGLFPALPASAIDALLARAKRFRVSRGQTVIREGDAAEYYYVIEAGRCRVTRKVGGGELQLAELGGGDAFGEDALIEGHPRSATVTMLTDGVVLRIARADFVRFLREPLLRRISRADAETKVRAGAVWVDVRYPAEHLIDGIAGAINIPLNEIRNASGPLDSSREYILYCQSGKRSAAAAFLLAQRGHMAYALEGGLHHGGAQPG
jgi:rhodanese-related sulfurtransferase